MGQAWGTLMPLGGVPETSSSLCRESPPIFAAGVLQRLRQTLFDLCGRPLSMSAADLGAYLRQRLEGACGRPRVKSFILGIIPAFP